MDQECDVNMKSYIGSAHDTATLVTYFKTHKTALSFSISKPSYTSSIWNFKLILLFRFHTFFFPFIYFISFTSFKNHYPIQIKPRCVNIFSSTNQPRIAHWLHLVIHTSDM